MSAVQADPSSIEAMVEFIRTRLDDDETAARRQQAMDAQYEAIRAAEAARGLVPAVVVSPFSEIGSPGDPDRVLAQVAAHRVILDLFDPPDREVHPGEPCTNDIEADPDAEYYSEYDSCDRHLREMDRRRADGRFSSVVVLRHLATMYAGREGWREEWRLQ